jgi:hypothetical protein
MRKYSKILLISGLVLIGGPVLLNIAELSHTNENINTEGMFEVPSAILKYQREFKRVCKKSDLGCKQYGSPTLVGDLDTGRLRPKQRMLVMHKSLDTIKEKLDSFPSPDRKKAAMENIANRMAVVKDNM